MQAKPFCIQDSETNWIEASPKAATEQYAASAGQKPDVHHMHAQSDAELAAHGVRRIDNRTPVVDRYEVASLVAITASGDRATAQWAIVDAKLETSQALLASRITAKYAEAMSAGVVMAVADGKGENYRFATDEAAERRYTVAATALSLGMPWDNFAKWQCIREGSVRSQRLALNEAEFRALYFLAVDHWAAANKRHDKLQGDVENASDVPDLRVIEETIDNGWPS